MALKERGFLLMELVLLIEFYQELLLDSSSPLANMVFADCRILLTVVVRCLYLISQIHIHPQIVW
jgi:hypothetical protein